MDGCAEPGRHLHHHPPSLPPSFLTDQETTDVLSCYHRPRPQRDAPRLHHRPMTLAAGAIRQLWKASLDQAIFCGRRASADGEGPVRGDGTGTRCRWEGNEKAPVLCWTALVGVVCGPACLCPQSPGSFRRAPSIVRPPAAWPFPAYSVPPLLSAMGKIFHEKFEFFSFRVNLIFFNFFSFLARRPRPTSWKCPARCSSEACARQSDSEAADNSRHGEHKKLYQGDQRKCGEEG